jgi:hypothetical protein
MVVRALVDYASPLGVMFYFHDHRHYEVNCLHEVFGRLVVSEYSLKALSIEAIKEYVGFLRDYFYLCVDPAIIAHPAF